MELNDVIRFLIENKYITEHNKKYKFTALFYKDLTGVAKGLMANGEVLEPALPAIVREGFDNTRISVYKQADWVNQYTEFLKLCAIPDKGLTNHGETYALNKYSEEGMKAFQKAMKSGYDYVTLIAAIKLYYTGTTRFKKAIGNYMKDGDWRTDYERVKEHFANGTLGELVKQESQDGTRTNYVIG